MEGKYTARMTTGSTNPIHFISEGEGAPVILIHGLASSLLSWEAVVPALSGYRCYALDLPGHGESMKPASRAFYQTAPILALVEEWIRGLALEESPVLIGHSLGGYLGLSYALRNPGAVRGLFLIDPFINIRQVTPLLRLMQPRARLGERAVSVVPEKLLAILLGLDPREARRFSPTARRQMALDVKRASPMVLNIIQNAQDLTLRLPEVRCPVALAWGMRDPTLSPASFPALLALLPGATGYRIPGAGHQPHIQTPQRINGLVLDFLQKYAANSTSSD